MQQQPGPEKLSLWSTSRRLEEIASPTPCFKLPCDSDFSHTVFLSPHLPTARTLHLPPWPPFSVQGVEGSGAVQTVFLMQANRWGWEGSVRPPRNTHAETRYGRSVKGDGAAGSRLHPALPPSPPSFPYSLTPTYALLLPFTPLQSP